MSVVYAGVLPNADMSAKGQVMGWWWGNGVLEQKFRRHRYGRDGGMVGDAIGVGMLMVVAMGLVVAYGGTCLKRGYGGGGGWCDSCGCGCTSLGHTE